MVTNNKSVWAECPEEGSGVIQAILNLAEKGYKVFPCLPMRKAPATANGIYDATDNREQILKWAKEIPECNWAIACEDLIVIDCDEGNAWNGVSHLLEEGGCAIQQTPSGGAHFIFRRPPGKNWGNSTGRLAPKIDTRTDGGYILVAPSKDDRGEYAFTRELPRLEALSEPPEWLATELDATFLQRESVTHSPNRQIAPGDDVVERAIKYVDACPEAVSGQGGHAQTFAVAAALVHGFALDEEQSLDILAEYYNPRCLPPWSEKELRHKVASSMKNLPTKPRGWLLERNTMTETNGTATVDISKLIETAQPEQEEDVKFFHIWKCPDLMEADLRQDFLIEGVLVEGQPLIMGGPKKCLKTSILLDMCVALASGEPFLRHFHVPKPRRVLMMTSESGLVTVRDTIARIADAVPVEAEELDKLFICDKVPMIGSLEQMDELVTVFEEIEPEVVICDPAYLMITTDKPESLFATGKQLNALTQVCADHGATLVLAHHNSKGCNILGRTPELDDLSWSGFAEFARQWILLGRKKLYDPLIGRHELFLSIGGSFGHGGEYDIAINEGVFPDRTWDAQLLDIGGIVGQQVSSADKHQAKVIAALHDNPEGLSKKKIREIAGLNNPNAIAAIDALIVDKVIEGFDSTHGVNNTKIRAYKLVDTITT